MEGPIIGALVSSTLPMLFKLIEERRDTLKGLDADVDSIKAELEYIRSEIREHRRSPKEMTDSQRTQIKDMRRVAQEIEDCVEGFLPSHEAKKVNREHFVEKIGLIKKRLKDMRERIKNYSEDSASSPLKEDSASSSGSSGSPSSPNLSMAELKVLDVAMEEPLMDLLALMKESERPSGGDVKVISIVGFDGMGKTLLARQVYNHVRDHHHHQYPRHAFVRATGKDKKEILQEILQKLQEVDVKNVPNCESSTNQAAEQMEAMCPAGTCVSFSVPQIKTAKSTCIDEKMTGKSTCIEEKMTGKSAVQDMNSVLPTNRYLIVVDDVQTEELAVNITSAFRDFQNKRDSRIIVTTTIQSVAERCSSSDGHVYKIRALSEEHSKRLFFGEEQPSDATMDSIAEWKKCDGVALALLSIARYCDRRLVMCKDAWNKLCTPGGKDVMLEQMQKVLEHSYVSLPSLVLQDCLLYFSMFPRGHPIRSGSLIRQWLAEGLALDGDGSAGSVTRPADAAVRNLKMLVDRNVIWPIQVGINEDIKTAKPPGVILDYIVRRSRADEFIMVHSGHETGASRDIRRLSLHHADHVHLLQEDLSRLRTLAVFDGGEGLSFAKCLLLRVLDLETCPGLKKSHLDEICELLRVLRYLSLGAGIAVIPRKIARLEWLETLHMGKNTVVTVPAEVLELPCLKHLIGKLKLRRYDSGKTDLDKFLSGKSKLETLAGFVAGKGGGGFLRLMRHMRRLRKVKIWLDCKRSKASSRNMTEHLSQGIKEFLDKNLDDDGLSLSIDFQYCTEPPFLGRLGSPSGNLSSLKLRGDDLSQMHAFVQNLGGIRKLCLSSATLDWKHVVDGTGSLRLLQYLKLEADSAIISTQQQDGALVVQQADEQFNSLERICLLARESLPQLTINPGALRQLIALHLICENLDGHSANQICQLLNLKEVALHSGINSGVKETWKEAARGHPRRPNVVSVGAPSPRSEGGTAQPSSGASIPDEATPSLQLDPPAGPSTVAPSQQAEQLPQGSSSSHENEDQALSSASNQQENYVPPPPAGSSENDHTPPSGSANPRNVVLPGSSNKDNESKPKKSTTTRIRRLLRRLVPLSTKVQRVQRLGK